MTLKSSPRPHSLALYKNRPALVKQVGDKLEIELEDGNALKVRPKDITLLHPGPLNRLSDLQPRQGEVTMAWELLAGSQTSLAELAELIYEEFTPVTAWAAWQLVDDGLYFKGTPEEVTACTAAEVAQTRAARAAKAAEEQAWSEFLERARTGQIEAADEPFLREVEDLALERRDKSRVLRELGRAESRENAHALLLELGYWPPTFNPYPIRLSVPTGAPELDLPGLPDELRLDLTHLPAFAIDDEGSSDPDDALSLDGHRLWVHIADVAALIQPGSPADIEARGRGANLYLPEGTAPMLPHRATQMLALGLTNTSPALSFGLDLNDDVEVINLEIALSWVRVQRLSYEDVETRLAESPFADLYRLAQKFQQRREANGAALIELPEVKVRVVDDEIIIRPLPPLKSRNLVREAMLMAGQVIANYAVRHNIPFTFTSQEPPDENDFPDTMAGMFARRKTFKRSQVSSVPTPHAGLGLDIYTQATSPLRRYADLVAHQQLRAHLRGQGVLSAAEVLERVGAAEAVSGSARQAERLSNKHWTLVYLMRHPNWRGQGVLVDKRNLRGTVLIPDLDLETRLHLREDLPLDSVISLALKQVQLPELEAYFQVAGRVNVIKNL